MQLEPNTIYWIARGQEVFGPYSGTQVREYVASGNIVPSDMIRSETASEWISVAVVLGVPVMAGAAAGPTVALGPDPGKAWAIAGIVSSALGILCCACGAPVGLILGIVALSLGRKESRTLAWASIALGILGILLFIGMTVLFQFYPELNPMDKLLKQLQNQ
jgi:hypothetical protein